METIMLNASRTTSTFKRAFIFLSIALLTSFASFAQDKTVASDESAFVNFLKVQNGDLYFTVKFNNSLGRRFDITVHDAFGENLYRGNFSGKDFGKVFRAPVELGKLVVTIRSFATKAEHKFEISSEARTVRDAYVTAVQ
jgi:hypothetical protein